MLLWFTATCAVVLAVIVVVVNASVFSRYLLLLKNADIQISNSEKKFFPFLSRQVPFKNPFYSQLEKKMKCQNSVERLKRLK